MVMLLFNLWPLATMTICPVTKNAKVGTKVCQILYKSSKNCPMTIKIWPKWQNFVKSGHTGQSYCMFELLLRKFKPRSWQKIGHHSEC